MTHYHFPVCELRCNKVRVKIDFIWSEKWSFSGASHFIMGGHFHHTKLLQLFHSEYSL